MSRSYLWIGGVGSLIVHGALFVVLFISSSMPPLVVHERIMESLLAVEMVEQEVLKEELLPPKMIEKPILKSEPIVSKKVEIKASKVIKKSQELPVAPPSHDAMASAEVFSRDLAENHDIPQNVTAVAPSSSSIKEVSHDDVIKHYLAKVRQKVQGTLRYSSMVKKMALEGETIVQFLIYRDGNVDKNSIKIAKSSGKALLDRNAIDAILEALPFESPPQDMIEIVLPIVFKLQS